MRRLFFAIAKIRLNNDGYESSSAKFIARDIIIGEMPSRRDAVFYVRDRYDSHCPSHDERDEESLDRSFFLRPRSINPDEPTAFLASEIGKWFRDLEISPSRPSESRADCRTREDGTVLTVGCIQVFRAYCGIDSRCIGSRLG